MQVLYYSIENEMDITCTFTITTTIEKGKQEVGLRDKTFISILKLMLRVPEKAGLE